MSRQPGQWDLFWLFLAILVGLYWAYLAAQIGK